MSDLAAITSDDSQFVEAELLPPDDQTANHILGSVISDQSSPTFEEVRFRLSPGAAVSPGDFVSIEARSPGSPERSWVLARVLDVHEINPHEDPQSATVRDVLPFDSDYAHEGESTVIYRIARTEPVEFGIIGRSLRAIAIDEIQETAADALDRGHIERPLL